LDWVTGLGPSFEDSIATGSEILEPVPKPVQLGLGPKLGKVPHFFA